MNLTRRARRLICCILPILAFANSGCAINNTDGGILAGGGLGAAAGALIGSRTGNAGTGALLGGALGATAGGITGAAIDNSERRAAARANARPPLSPDEVVQLARNGVGDEVIINQIRTTGSMYRLTAQDILNLRSAGVSDAVIREMQSAQRRPAAVYTAVPVEPVYVIHPPPPPPVGFGVTYIRRR